MQRYKKPEIVEKFFREILEIKADEYEINNPGFDRNGRGGK